MSNKLLFLVFFLAINLSSIKASSEEYDEETGEIVKTLKNPNVNIAVVGGGLSGLAAFKRLRLAGAKNVDLFEASDRLGGRVFPVPFEDGYLQQGAEYIESLGNPLYDLAEKLNVLNDSWELSAETIFDIAAFKTGKCTFEEEQIEEFKKFAQELEEKLYELAAEEDNYSKTIGSIYKESFDKYIKSKKRSAAETKLINALSEYYKNYYAADWSASIDNVSVKNLNIWDPLTANKSTIVLNKIGYKAILDELTKDLPHEVVHLSSKVTLIDYSGAKTKLKINDNKVHDKEYDYVIVTVPLGHLKAYAKEMFKPELPQQKLDVISVLGFGSLQKIFIVYDKPFWAEDGYNTVFVPLQVEGCVESNSLSPALLTIEAIHWKPNVLLAWVVGDASKIVDNMDDQQLSNEITKHFKATMTDVTVTSPQKIVRKSWLKDDNYLGSYSYITTESIRYSDPFKLLAKPVYNQKVPKVLFAGEATHSQLYQTTVGAYLSGEREANRVLKFVQKYSKN